jgi:hypothetical protein
MVGGGTSICTTIGLAATLAVIQLQNGGSGGEIGRDEEIDLSGEHAAGLQAS